MRGLIVCLFLLISGNILAQNAVNQLDALGRKQGIWTKKDADGKLIYQATFKEDKPVGEMKRFHPNGKIKAILNFEEGRDISDAQLFDERGKIIAMGKYSGQKKTGEWTYLLDSRVVSSETYLEGLKNGISKRYYKTGELLEESNWQNDQLNGIYRSYFQDGKLYLESNYSGGHRNGIFKTWFPNEMPEMDAFYTNDLRDKDWIYFDVSGKLQYTLKFKLGKLLNQEVQDSVSLVKAGAFKTKEDHIPDPEKFMQNPEEYMELMKNR
jgi:antitoxin component YwqK of YwqJK toxin-antitoxin module